MSRAVVDSMQMVVDSLRQVEVADSLHRIYVADSIATVRLATRDVIFGAESTLQRALPQYVDNSEVGISTLVENPIYTLLAILFTLLYLVWLPHILRGGSVKWSLMRQHVRHRDKADNRELISHQRIGMTIASWSLGVTLLSLFTARIVAQFSASDIEFNGATWILMGVGGVILIALYGWGVLKLGGYLTLHAEFVDKIMTMKRQLLFFGIIFSSPLFVISSMANYQQGEWILQLSLFVVVAFVLIFIRQSFLLFMRQNISILHWFLYLCGVEVLPLTLLWAVAARQMLL